MNLIYRIGVILFIISAGWTIYLEHLFVQEVKASTNTSYTSCNTKYDIRTKNGSVGSILVLYGRDSIGDGFGGLYYWEISPSIVSLPDDSNIIYHSWIDNKDGTYILNNKGVWIKFSKTYNTNKSNKIK